MKPGFASVNGIIRAFECAVDPGKRDLLKRQAGTGVGSQLQKLFLRCGVILLYFDLFSLSSTTKIPLADFIGRKYSGFPVLCWL